MLLLSLAAAAAAALAPSASACNCTTWHLVWYVTTLPIMCVCVCLRVQCSELYRVHRRGTYVGSCSLSLPLYSTRTGGQSNSVGTNSQQSGYPVWPTTQRIQTFCSYGNCKGKFRAAEVPLYNELNVGFSQTFANLLLPTLPEDHGIVLLNTGVGGTGFSDGNWVVPNGPLTERAIAAVGAVKAAVPGALGGAYAFHTMLWHQGEEDAGDNRAGFQASYCRYLGDDMGALVDHLRAEFPGASPRSPFLDGGMLPYWADAVHGTGGVMDAIYALNTSRAFTGTADSRIFPDFFPGTRTPDGEPGHRSGITGDVIHFNATQAVLMGHQYWGAYRRAVGLDTVVPSAKTAACKRGAGTPA